MKTIIVPVDFSPASFNAMTYAADMAMAVHAELILLHVVEIPVAVTESPLTGIGFDELQLSGQKRLYILKSQLLQRTSDKINIRFKSVIGYLSNELRSLCKKKAPFAIIMTMESASAFERFFAGSHTVSAATNLPYPVWVIPQDSTFKVLKKICFASDLKDISNVPTEYLRELLSAFNASLDILYIAKNEEEKLKNIAPASILELHLKEFHPQMHFIVNENIEEGIHKFTTEYGENIVLVLHKKHTFFESLFRESHTKKLIVHSDIPTLAISAN